VSCEKHLRGWPSAVVNYVCGNMSLFPGINPGEYVKGVKTLIKFGVMPTPEDFRQMADVYRRNPYGKRTWGVIIAAVTAAAKAGEDPFAQLEEMMRTGVRRWWFGV